VPVQARALDHWPDGSIRWALIDTWLDTTQARVDDYVVRVGGRAGSTPDFGLRVVAAADELLLAWLDNESDVSREDVVELVMVFFDAVADRVGD